MSYSPWYKLLSGCEFLRAKAGEPGVWDVLKSPPAQQWHIVQEDRGQGWLFLLSFTLARWMEHLLGLLLQHAANSAVQPL